MIYELPCRLFKVVFCYKRLYEEGTNHMKQKLLLTTALVWVLSATNAMATERIENSDDYGDIEGKLFEDLSIQFRYYL